MKASSYYSNKKQYGVILDNGCRHIVVYAFSDKRKAQIKADQINKVNTELKNDIWCFVDQV
jgi:hypothetical protein